MSTQKFLNACKKGSIKEVQYMYNDNTINVQNGLAFIYACTNGHLELAQWLCYLGERRLIPVIDKWSPGNVNIYANNNLAFRSACMYGHLKVVQWLYSIYVDMGHTISYDDFFILKVWQNRHYEVVRWLRKIQGITFYNFMFKWWIVEKCDYFIIKCHNRSEDMDDKNIQNTLNQRDLSFDKNIQNRRR